MRFGQSLGLVGFGDGAAADGHDVVDDGVAEQYHVVQPFPSFVDVLVDGRVCSEKPLAFGTVGVIHVAVDHVHFPLKIHVEIAPCLGAVYCRSARAERFGSDVVALHHGLVHGVHRQEVVAACERAGKDKGQSGSLEYVFHLLVLLKRD